MIFFKGKLREQKERQSVPSDQCERSGKMSKEQCYNLVTFGVMLPVIGYLCCVMQDFNLFFQFIHPLEISLKRL